MDSQLQYFAPELFWKSFKLWGQPVNVREQQVSTQFSMDVQSVSLSNTNETWCVSFKDAFEFFCNLTDQLDEQLKVFEPLFIIIIPKKSLGN